MTDSPRLSYVQARIQARFSERPGPAVWSALDQIRDFGRYVQRAGAAGLYRWLEKTGTDAGPHVVETSLRDAFRRHVREVAGWMPNEWRSGVEWFALTIDLEQLAGIEAGRQLPAWMDNDPFLAPLARSRGWPLSVLKQESAPALGTRWRERWRSIWPDLPHRETKGLDNLLPLLPVEKFEDDRVGQFERLFRRHACSPAAVFCHLALTLSDLLRLRGEMLRRLAFPETGQEMHDVS